MHERRRGGPASAAARRRTVGRWPLLLVCLLLACGGPGAPTGTRPPTAGTATRAGPARFEEVAACPFALPPGWASGTSVSCGYVAVPERHERPDGPTIRLAVVRFRSAQDPPAAAPLVYLEGGPGGSVAGLVAGFNNGPWRSWATARDVVLFDQRGAGRSEPSLACPEATQQRLRNVQRAEDARFEAAQVSDALLRCRDRLVAQGIDLAAYTTAASAADVDAIRTALGYARVDLLGVSYGTTVALRVMRDYPRAVRSVVLDSVAPPQVDWPETAAATYDRALALAFAACVAARACGVDAATLAGDFALVAAALNATPRPVALTDERGQRTELLVTGDDLVALVHQWLYWPWATGAVPALIEELKAGGATHLQRLLQQSGGRLLSEAIALGMHYSVVCAEKVGPQSARRAEAEAQRAPPPIRAVYGDRARFPYAICAQWPAAPPDAAARAAVVSDLPTLVLASANDPATPPAWGQLAAQTLARGRYVEVPGVGHGVFATDCGTRLILAFLADPAAAPDTGCTSSMGTSYLPTP